MLKLDEGRGVIRRERGQIHQRANYQAKCLKKIFHFKRHGQLFTNKDEKSNEMSIGHWSRKTESRKNTERLVKYRSICFLDGHGNLLKKCQIYMT